MTSFLRRSAVSIGAVTLVAGSLAACQLGIEDDSAGPPRPSPVTVAPEPGLAAPAPSPAAGPSAPAARPAVQRPLRVSPERGPVGTSFTVAGDGLAPGQTVELQWGTWEGSYVLDTRPEHVRFSERKFEEKRISLGSAAVDTAGRLAATLNVPEDYGEVHDVYAMADGREVARGGFRVLRTVEFAPAEGPVGTPILVTVQGMGWKPMENTMAVRYDNKYTGFVSAVTTRGTATFQVRAAGPPGKHVLQLTGASPGLPYLNLQQSAVAHVPAEFQWTFSVTGDGGAPPDSQDWPDRTRVIATDAPVPRSAPAGASTGRAVPAAALDPASGPALSPTTLTATDLPEGGLVQAFWVTARGDEGMPRGWGLSESPLFAGKAGTDGKLSAPIQVPDDLGGWHLVKLVQEDRAVAEIPFFVERSMVDISPRRVAEGETVRLRLKGVGRTELDSGIAVTYDNAYVGFACGTSSSGDVILDVVATGGVGTHLIDLYPMIYRAKGNHPPEYWNFQIPHLTALEDGPGLALGYNLPIFRLAIEVAG